MARLIHTDSSTGARVYYEHTDSEYYVVPHGEKVHSAGTYYTDDKQDAINTGAAFTRPWAE